MGAIRAIVPSSSSEAADSHFLFLGYTMRDWNLRVFLTAVFGEQLRTRSWAIQRDPTLDSSFWQGWGSTSSAFRSRVRDELARHAAASASQGQAPHVSQPDSTSAALDRREPVRGTDALHGGVRGAGSSVARRERAVIIGNLRASRLTLLYAESGVGKSSLLRAGVAARLRAVAEQRARGARLAAPRAGRLQLVERASRSRRSIDAIGDAIEPFLRGGDAGAPARRSTRR